ncbi:MAG: NitT/TauT family transport system permease protein [Thermoleophilaceae bacterium]|nr:NitT/TauT family transport system permease protein [Thermoleophilaceae bacterium]
MSRVRRIAPPAILLALVILAWQGIASTSLFDNYTLASPTEVIRAFRQDHSLLLDEAGVTTVEILLGLAASIVLGFGGAIAMHLVRPLRDAAYPLFVASQAVPFLVLAPILVVAFDYGLAPKVALIALICFFPIAVNTLDGLRSVDPSLIKLMQSFGASRLTRLWKAELPASLPFIFSGLKLAATVSVIGAVFAEFSGAEGGLGRLVLLANNQLQTPRLYAGTVLLMLMSIALFAIVSILERLAVPWKGNS